MTKDDDARLVCTRVVEHAAGPPGGRQATCVQCQHAVWVSKSSEAVFVDYPKTEIICMPCAVAAPDFTPDNMRLHESQVQEALDFLRMLGGDKPTLH